MLQITIPEGELWDESKQEFIHIKEQTLQLEHSLISISKWESKWCKTFLSKQEKTYEETIDYIKCMTLTQKVDPDVYNHLTRENIEQINQYIQAPMSATYFANDPNGRQNNEKTTSELIYYWMIALNIPVEFEKWHLNRLLTLIRVCNVKSNPDKKGVKPNLSSRAALNNARRQKLGTKG